MRPRRPTFPAHLTDASVVGVPGPWEHRFVGAHGIRFHVAVCEPPRPPADGSSAPVVLLLHGALQNWYAWRGVLPVLAAAGYRAVAPDLRGHGASDATPRGYDAPGLADDVDALVRSLGVGRAVVVGHDLGGWVGWTLAARHPERLHGLAAVAAPPPGPDLLRGRALRSLLAVQAPSLPEHVLLHRDGIRSHLDGVRATPAPPGDVAHYLACVRVPSVAHTSLEPWRWLARASLRPDGRRWWRAVRARPALPVLEVVGGSDRFAVRAPGPAGRDGDARPAGPPPDVVVLPGVGHLVPEEAPDALLGVLLPWLREVSPPGHTGPPGS